MAAVNDRLLFALFLQILMRMTSLTDNLVKVLRKRNKQEMSCHLDKRSHSSHYHLTHWDRDNMAAILWMTFSNAFSWMKIYEFQFHWNLFLRVQSTIFQDWFRWWLGVGQATSHYLDQWWYSLLTHLFITRTQWLNISRPQHFVERYFFQLHQPRMLCCHCLPPGSLHVLGAFGWLA